MADESFLAKFENIDFENISLEDLVHLEDEINSLVGFAEEGQLKIEAIKGKINQTYNSKYRGCRETVHKIRTGFVEEPYISVDDILKHRSLNGWNPNNGWKFHLDVVPNRKHPVTKEVSDFLLSLDVSHKIASGGKNGKGMTVYVGSYNDVVRLATEIQERFGDKIPVPPSYTDQVRTEKALTPVVYARFNPGHHNRYSTYPVTDVGVGLLVGVTRYAVPSILLDQDQDYQEKVAISLDSLKEAKQLFWPESKAVRWKLLIKDFKHQDKTIQATQVDPALLLEYCHHKLYTKYVGQYYCGNDSDAFEAKIFGDRLPPQGSKERSDWDHVATLFEQDVKDYDKEKYHDENHTLNFLKSFPNGYIPVDFEKLQSQVQNMNSTIATNTDMKGNSIMADTKYLTDKDLEKLNYDELAQLMKENRSLHFDANNVMSIASYTHHHLPELIHDWLQLHKDDKESLDKDKVESLVTLYVLATHMYQTKNEERGKNPEILTFVSILKELRSRTTMADKTADVPNLEQGSTERATTTVNKLDEKSDIPTPVYTPEDKSAEEEKSWMDIKREVWQEFAASVEHTLTEEDKDNKEKETLEFILSKEEEPKGKVLYSSATNVQITADSELVMYQGLVHDAIKGEMSITFGSSLSEKQKLMLYAAALMSEEKYKNGEKIQLIGAPEIDLNNEVFKSLPKEVQKVLKEKVVDREEKREIGGRDAVRGDEGAIKGDEVTDGKAKITDLRKKVQSDSSERVSCEEKAKGEILKEKRGIVNPESKAQSTPKPQPKVMDSIAVAMQKATDKTNN